MNKSNNLIIHKAIAHISDISISSPILSQLPLDINDEIYEYLVNQIYKLIEIPNSKKYELLNNNENCNLLLLFDGSNFETATQTLSNNIFSIMQKCTSITSSVLIFCLFESEGNKKICMLKLNYKDSYTYKINEVDDYRCIQLIRYKASLPNLTHKASEGFIYEIDANNLYIYDKRYLIEEDRQFLLSNLLFNLPFTLSPKDTYDTIEKVSKKMVKEYFDNDIEKNINIKKEIVESFNTKGSVDLNKISDVVFESDHIVKERYNEELKSSGIKEETVKLDYKLDKKINKKQRIKTEEGIEILIPVDYLDDTDKVLFNTNSDGTINIVMKCLNSI